MEKEFIPYEQALTLKELGFNQKCLGQYNISQGDKWIFSIDLSGEGQYPLTSPACITPLYQQAFRWFREKYDLDGKPEYFLNDWYCFIINDMKEEDTSRRLFTEFPSYEEAELACLEKLIEIVEIKE